MKTTALLGIGEMKEIAPDVWDYEFTEKKYPCTIKSRRPSENVSNSINGSIRFNGDVEIVASPSILNSIPSIKYVVLYDERWTVESMQISGRRVIMQLGGVYNGPRES